MPGGVDQWLPIPKVPGIGQSGGVCRCIVVPTPQTHVHPQGPLTVSQALAHAHAVPGVTQDLQVPYPGQKVIDFLYQGRACACWYIGGEKDVIPKLYSAEPHCSSGPIYIPIVGKHCCSPVLQLSPSLDPQQGVQLCALGRERPTHWDAEFSAPQFPHCLACKTLLFNSSNLRSLARHSCDRTQDYVVCPSVSTTAALVAAIGAFCTHTTTRSHNVNEEEKAQWQGTDHRDKFIGP